MTVTVGSQQNRLAEWETTSGGRPIPEGWRLVRLGEVSDHCLGKMLDQQNQVHGNLLPYLRNVDVQWFRIDASNLQQMRFQERELKRFDIKDGDLIVCEGGEPGRAAIWDKGYTRIKFQKALHRVRTAGELLNRFLAYRLRYDTLTGRLNWYFTGTTIKHFTGQDLDRYLFPMPALPIQRRIAAILDKADRLRRIRCYACELGTFFLQTVFLKVFGEPSAFDKTTIGRALKLKSGDSMISANMGPEVPHEWWTPS